MAFTLENLGILGNATKSGVVPVVYSYWNEEDDDVTTAGYFEDLRLKVGDQIQVTSADYTTLGFYRISAIVDTIIGAATAVLLASLLPEPETAQQVAPTAPPVQTGDGNGDAG
jgi:hypothetical protein